MQNTPPVVRVNALLQGGVLPNAIAALLVVSCAVLEFFPFDLLGLSSFANNVGLRVSALVSPVLMSLVIALLYSIHPDRIRTVLWDIRRELFISIIVAGFVALSALVNGFPDWRVPLVAGNFVIGTMFVLLIHRQPSGPMVPNNNVMLWILVAWSALPVVVAPFNTLERFFISCNPFATFHGFSSGRLLFGYWAGFVVVMLSGVILEGKDPSRAMRLALFFCFCGVVASQTRSAIGLTTIVVVLMILFGQRSMVQTGLVIIAGFIFGLLLHTHVVEICNADPISTTEATRFRALEFRDPTRWEIYRRFIPGTGHDWLWGEGQMKLVSIESVGSGIQAHNLFLQTLANFGLFTMLSLVIWCGLMFRQFRSLSAKLLFGYSLGYSLFQPFFGGSLNFFSPKVLLTFMLIVYFDHSLNYRIRRTS